MRMDTWSPTRRLRRTEDILKLRRSLRVGDQVSIRIYRDGEYLDLTMEMMADN